MKTAPLHPDQWELYRGIRLRALLDAPNAFGSTHERERDMSERDWRGRLEQARCRTFAAFTDDGAPAGLIVAAPYEDATGLYAMWVDPDYRGEGIASALVDEVVRWSKARGFSRILLDVADENLAAIALYESKGFQATGVRGSLPPPREHIQEHQRCLDLSNPR